MNNALPKRKNIRLKEYDYSSPGWYYVTICTQDHRCLFGEIQEGKIELNQYGEVVEEIISQLPNRYLNIDLDIYQIMPNHIHGIIVINGGRTRGSVPTLNGTNNVGAALVGARTDDQVSTERAGIKPAPTPNLISLGEIVGTFKSLVTNRYIQNVKTNDWPPFHKRLFQRNYYDHVIRGETDLNKIRHYIKTNPEKWSEDKYYSSKNSRG